MPLKVLMVTPYFPPIVNGPSFHVFNLVNGLRNQGVNVHVNTFGYNIKENILSAVDQELSISYFKPFSPFRTASFDQPLSVSYIKNTLEACKDFDIIHIHDFPKICNDSLILTLKKINPSQLVVLTPHGAGPLSPASKFSSKLYWASGVPLKVVKSVDALITVTSLQEKAFSKVCSSQKIFMIPEAVPDYYFVAEPSFSNDNKLRILFIGRIIQEKGIRDLLHAVSIVEKFYPKKIELRCIGPDYGYMCEALNLIKKLGLVNVVHFLGVLSEEQKLINLSWCDVLVLPSFYEAFGIPIIEAMAHGKPVIATKTIGALSLVRHNKTGFLVDLGDSLDIANKLMLFLKDSQLRLQMGQKALHSVLTFCNRNMTENHIKLYHELAANNFK